MTMTTTAAKTAARKNHTHTHKFDHTDAIISIIKSHARFFFVVVDVKEK